MAKNAPVKKSKRKLKRSVRRSVAAVLMITAIGVAAVPVPENVAALPEGRAAAQDNHTVYSYEELKTRKSEADGSDIKDSALDNLFEEASNNHTMLGKYQYNEDGTPNDTENDKIENKEKSLKIIDNGLEQELTWEYMYYEANSNVVLCRYNDRYPRGDVNLAPAPNIDYFKVLTEDFNNYFTKGGTTVKAGTINVSMRVDPTKKEVLYAYQDYQDQTDIKQRGDLDFFNNYAQDLFDTKTSAFRTYEQNLADYNRAKQEWEGREENSGQTYPEKAPEIPKPIQMTMAEAIGDNTTNRVKFFCDYCTTLNNYGDGYTLRAVRDTTDEKAGEDATYAYVAYGGTPKEPGIINVDGYMVTRQGKYVSAIGEYAFRNIGNVDNINLPTLVHFIGDNAFYHCNSVKVIHIENVKVIGNNAFQSCGNLTTLSMGIGVEEIGSESFEGCEQLTSISFSSNTQIIRAGAFANCTGLAVLDMDNIIENCEVGAAAFYNCAALTQVNMTNSHITKIGDSAFATVKGDNLANFTFPSTIVDDPKAIGNRMFSGRIALQTVVFPSQYGRNKAITIPESMFHGCSRLQYVEFPTMKGDDPTACANLTYTTGGDTSKELFADVTNKNFYISGPKQKTNGDVAEPRQATWSAFTKAYDEPGFIPYLYYEDGVEYYEICSDDYLECIRRNPDGTGTLTSCTLKPDADPPAGGTLIIPDKVGDTVVVAIDTDCFSDRKLTESVKKLVINDNIREIAASTFENTNGKWNKLQEATVGSSVVTMGANAFYNCINLTDITFNTPINNDYTQLDFPGSALHTNGDKLTIHGDIVKGYRPFEYAVDPNTYVKDERTGIRVCYQSRWDSPSSKHLMVMYGVADDKTGVGKSGYVTLLDYPKYSELEDMDGFAGAELNAHCLEREQQFYEKYATAVYDAKRTAFADAWETAADANEIYKNIQLYGPWINDEFCDDWTKWKTSLANASGADSNGMFDWLFEPLVTEAAPGTPRPYFETNSFNFMTNYKKCHGNESEIPRFDDTNELIDYLGWNDFEKQMISSVEDIVIPAGVESIDVRNFYENNGMNFNTYSTKSEYVVNGGGVTEKQTIPGLFSGWFKDYEEDDPNGKGYEAQGKGVRGNDRIRSVTMTTVLYLPDYAFDNCERLTAVTLGEGMEKVGALPFRDCPELVNLTGNAKYPAENGILYETQSAEPESYKIVECLQARGTGEPIAERTLTELTDPKIAYVESIAENAFENCDRLSLADLSSAIHLTEIAEGTFKDCDSLTRITLPASVNDIKDDAFAGICAAIPAPTLRFTVEIPGTEVSISDNAFGRQDEYVPDILPDFAKERVKILTYKDTAAYRYAVYYAKEQMEVETYPDSENTYSVVFMDYDGTQLGDIQYIVNDFATIPDTTELEDPNHRPGYTFNGTWLGTNGQDVGKKISANCMFFAQYDSDGTMVNGKYAVEFRDGINGHQLSGRYANPDDGKYYIEPGSSFAEKGWEAPTRESHDDEGFEPLDPNPWSGNWTENTVIDSNMTVIALYRAKNTSGGSTSTPGTGSGGSTTTPSGSTTSSSRNTTSSSNSSSTTSTTSGSDSTVGKYTVTVENGSGSGSYDVGSTVIIAANTPAAGMVFQKWTTESNGVALASVSMTATTFTMPANNVTVTANYVAAPTPVSVSGSNGNTGNTGNTGNGNTRVDITKPGISNKDLATANVNGSTDNFIVKITETDEATRAVQEALTNKYGSLESLLYYAMDISLYDSTGTYKITDTTGLSVDITIPIPDALVMYGGNNMAGAVINGNQLESLNESFTTINGVPCIRFTATHFSPYTIYVDTGNLTEGMLDMTPKTGDPIHPKWFLSIGLACLSIILFMKKDKAAKVKTA